MIAQPTVASFEEFVAPVIALNQIALAYTEKVVELNLTVLRKQADLALTGWREALAIKDAEQVKEYLAHQGEVVRTVVDGYVTDAKVVAELNQEVANDMRNVVEAGVTKAAKQAA